MPSWGWLSGWRPQPGRAASLPTWRRPLPLPPAALFEAGISLRWMDGRYWRSTTYESNVLYALRFMIDCGVVGGNWVELPPGGYDLVQGQVGCGGRRGVGG